MDEIHLTVRMPKWMHPALKASAIENVRSLNSEIIWALKCYLNDSETEQLESEKDEKSIV